MSGGYKYNLYQTAYLKLILHAVKHPASAVNGLLIGKVSNSGPQNGDAENKAIVSVGGAVELCDAVPLFHSHLELAPMLEVALAQVDEYYASQAGGLSIVGYYHANERYDDVDLGPAAKKVADKIAQYVPQAAVLLIDNTKLEQLRKPTGAGALNALQLFTSSRSSWQRNTRLSLRDPLAGSVLVDFLSERKYRSLSDFDDHLDDVSKDWRNVDIFQ